MMNPKYPIYIISKNRGCKCLTANTLDNMGVPYKLVIEPQELFQYKKFTGKILTLPFNDLGKGSIPARNWVWEHSIRQGTKRHWILDDNIRWFYRYNNNLKHKVASGTIFKITEDFVDRYTNIALSGFQYAFFATSCRKRPPFILNTRIYSCILIKNDLPYRWRGKYNEDTDLSLRVLKDGWCTVLFNAFLQGKTGTMTMSGGNTDELYKKDGRLKMAKSLMDQHPDLVTITDKKFGRWQHQVDFKLFSKNKLIKKEGVIIPKCVNNYGMKLVEITK